jgi:hypothetical protein
MAHFEVPVGGFTELFTAYDAKRAEAKQQIQHEKRKSEQKRKNAVRGGGAGAVKEANQEIEREKPEGEQKRERKRERSDFARGHRVGAAKKARATASLACPRPPGAVKRP